MTNYSVAFFLTLSLMHCSPAQMVKQCGLVSPLKWKIIGVLSVLRTVGLVSHQSFVIKFFFLISPLKIQAQALGLPSQSKVSNRWAVQFGLRLPAGKEQLSL